MKNVVAPPYWQKQHHYTCRKCGASFLSKPKKLLYGFWSIHCPECGSEDVAQTLADAVKDLIFDPRVY